MVELSIKISCRVIHRFTQSFKLLTQYLCHNFKAGQVAATFVAWRELTNDRVILSEVSGVSNVLLPLFNTDYLSKCFGSMNMFLFAKKYIN